MKETRSFKLNADSKGLILSGLAVVYDKPTTIVSPDGSEYIEIIRSGALDDADLSDCRLLYNHDSSKVPLARTPKTMKLHLSSAGLEFRASLSDENRDVYTAVKRGDLDGCSFCFTVPDEGDTYDPETNTRTIEKIKKVYELSVVPFPAYEETSIEARSSMAEARSDFELRKRLKIRLNKLRFKGRL